MRVLLVDDDKSILKILRGYLEQAGFEVLTTTNGETALHSLRADRPDLLVLDLMLPDKDGYDITRFVRADSKLSALPIIMLTARVDDTDKIIGLELGADDYITKPFNPREVVARIRALIRRAQFDIRPPTILQAGDLRLDVDRREIRFAGKLIELTPTEFSLLQILMEYPGHTFTREVLLEKGLGYGYRGDSRILDSHIRNLRKKIEPNPADPTYIQTVYRVGYRLSA